MDETFTLLPINLNETTKAVELTTSTNTSQILDLSESLSNVNHLHRLLLNSTQVACPPPPVPIHPNRSTQITKLREGGNNHFRKSQYPDAIKMYTLALDMALTRPAWEPSQLVRDECAPIYSNRCQAHVAMRSWADALADAESSCFCKPQGNPKAWYRRALCLKEMDMLEESREVLELALDWESDPGVIQAAAQQEGGVASKAKTDGELKGLLREVLAELGARERSGY